MMRVLLIMIIMLFCILPVSAKMVVHDDYQVYEHQELMGRAIVMVVRGWSEWPKDTRDIYTRYWLSYQPVESLSEQEKLGQTIIMVARGWTNWPSESWDVIPANTWYSIEPHIATNDKPFIQTYSQETAPPVIYNDQWYCRKATWWQSFVRSLLGGKLSYPKIWYHRHNTEYICEPTAPEDLP